MNHEGLRTRTHAVALQLEAADRQAAAEVMVVPHKPAKAAAADDHRVRRHARWRVCARSAGSPGSELRGDLRQGETVTAISNGDPALPALVRSATGGPVKFILSWFHLSMRVHHVEQVMGGLCALQPQPLAPPDHAQVDVERLRHLLCNGYHDKACEALGRIASWVKDAIALNDPAMGAGVKHLAARCTELQAYLDNKKDALIDYGQRHRAGKPISTLRAGGTVNRLVSARMNKRKQRRGSPRGAHRVLRSGPQC